MTRYSLTKELERSLVQSMKLCTGKRSLNDIFMVIKLWDSQNQAVSYNAAVFSYQE